MEYREYRRPCCFECPVGTTLDTFNSVNGSSSYSLDLSTAFFNGDADGLITLAIYNTNSASNGIGWTDGPTLNVTTTTIPEPSSTALLGLGGLALILRRRR